MLLAFVPQIIEFGIDPRILWLMFILAMIVYSLLSAILLYHWFAYSYARSQMKSISVVFFSVSGVFILISIGAATVFSLS